MEEPLEGNAGREQRILLRRQRVEEKVAAMRAQEEGNEAMEARKERKIGRGKQQVIESRKRLTALRTRTDVAVTQVKVTALQKERQRRETEEERRKELRKDMLVEAEQSAANNAQVASHWSELFSIEVPQDLWKAIQQQREACAKIVESKDKLVDDLRGELASKHEDFTRLLKRHQDEMDTLLTAMAAQHRETQAAYSHELQQIEDAFLLEQEELLAANKQEISALMDKRFNSEQQFQERTRELAEQYHKALDDLMVKDAEDYNKLKVNREGLIQIQEQHLEAMRATYQLNNEKLEYNYRVLVERDHENKNTINKQKRKIARQRDILSTLKARYHELDRKYQEENMRLTEEYKRVTELFKDLQSKFRHFEESDLKIYQEVWAVNDEVVAELVQRVLRADKTIHEQLLGWGWRPPHENTFQSPWEQIEKDMQTLATEADGEGEGAESAARQKLQERLQERKYMGLLSLLLDEAGFLIEARAKALLNTLPADEQGRVAVDAVLNALGVQDVETLDALVEHLSLKGRGRGLHSKSGASRLVPKESQKSEHSASPSTTAHQKDDEELEEWVPRDEVVQRLKVFVEQEGNQARSVKSKPGAASKVSVMTKRMMEKERLYWNNMTNVVSERGVRVWAALERKLQGYLKMLKHRQSRLEEVDSLQAQNDELRNLLAQYLSSRVNEELCLPPAHVM
ncbi:unnamed protein product [Pedinophyceae sp. YPF-701]|nr:unnamed protein product [Pedinophyceae sp. YPF-701]